MLLISAEQIKYCQLAYTKNNQQHTKKGMFYNNKLFTKIESFPKQEKHHAIEKAKFISVENKGHYLIIVVEETNTYDIWQQNDHVKIKSHETKDENKVSEINLEELVKKMRNVGGIRIENRRYNLRVYHRCFVGKEAVAWFMEHLKISHEKAIVLGQRLIQEKWIHHVTNEHEFKDENLFYRFYWDEKLEEKPEEKLLDGNKIKKFFSLS
ncbi:MAG: mechanosensitive ion channel protein [Nostocales cyanobacterium]|nr:MAG: mechanosensitive ion channel protein [Nostocales cyanobacterium]TAF21533.1 MAG: mechanosensitive ion channel protein [Nostocales cyanobacterium]